MENSSCKVSQNLSISNKHEFEILLCKVKIMKSCEKHNGKMVGFMNFRSYCLLYILCLFCQSWMENNSHFGDDLKHGICKHAHLSNAYTGLHYVFHKWNNFLFYLIFYSTAWFFLSVYVLFELKTVSKFWLQLMTMVHFYPKLLLREFHFLSIFYDLNNWKC